MFQKTHQPRRSRYYRPKEAVAYLAERGLPFTAGTLEVWRSKKKGPAYLKLANRVFYSKECLDQFIESGVVVKTVDSISFAAGDCAK